MVFIAWVILHNFGTKDFNVCLDHGRVENTVSGNYPVDFVSRFISFLSLPTQQQS
jgi:hypothetical protein